MFINYLAVLCGFQGPPRRSSRKIPVAHSERETPLPIPNRAVKPFSADGTWGATPWESRSPPVFIPSSPTQPVGLVALGILCAGCFLSGPLDLQRPSGPLGREGYGKSP